LLGVVPVVMALVGYVLGLVLAPDLTSNDRHGDFSDFFATAAQVIAALFIALALEARFFKSGPIVSILTFSYVAIGLVSSISALSPSLPGWVYCQLFGLTLGSGLAALLAAVLVAIALLNDDLAARQDQILDELLARGKRRDQDS
jgi:hypothetical protein